MWFMIQTLFYRTFASETTQFLAPFEASVRSTERETAPAATTAQPDEGTQVGRMAHLVSFFIVSSSLLTIWKRW